MACRSIYSGDEQGFAGDGGDQDAREDMFASQVAVLQRQSSGRHPGDDGAEQLRSQSSPVHCHRGSCRNCVSEHPALRGAAQIVRNFREKPGLFAVSRIDPQTGREILIAFNTSTVAIEANVEVDTRSAAFRSLHGTCPAAPWAPASYAVKLAPLEYVVCGAEVRRMIPGPVTGEASR